jgi:hypothetical protein
MGPGADCYLQDEALQGPAGPLTFLVKAESNSDAVSTESAARRGAAKSLVYLLALPASGLLGREVSKCRPLG